MAKNIKKRHIFREIGKYVDSPEVIVVTGMRRTGKTTTLRYFFDRISSDNKIFLDLENPLNQELFSKDNYEAIKAELEKRKITFEKKSYIFLDEVQFAKNIPSVVKYFYDHYQVKVFASGSASFYLKNMFSESLAGRKYIFELFPLTFEEFLWFKDSELQTIGTHEAVSKTLYKTYAPLYSEYLEYGGFPQVVLKEEAEEKRKALEDIFSAYFQKEVGQLGDFTKNSTVRKLILLLTERVGQKLDVQKLASEIQISRPTVYKYLDFLSGTYLISLVEAYGKADVSVRKQAKLYFIDSGLLSAIASVSAGSLFENNIYSQLRVNNDVCYYQKGQKEIDFVCKKTGYEVKRFASASDLRGAQNSADRLGLKKQYMVSQRYTETKNTLYGFQKLAA